MQRRESELLSPSPLVKDITGVGSIAEAAALAGAGENARLIVPKFSLDGVCCAVAFRPEVLMTIHFIGAGPGAPTSSPCAAGT